MLATFLHWIVLKCVCLSLAIYLYIIYLLSIISIYLLTIFVFLYLCLCCCHYFVTSSCLTLWNPMDYSLPGSSSMGFSRQEYKNGLLCPTSRGSSPPRDWTWVCCITDRFFTAEPPGKSISASIIFPSPSISIYHWSIYPYLRMCVCLYVFMCVCVYYLSILVSDDHLFHVKCWDKWVYFLSFFFNLNLFILIGGYLLYNIVLVLPYINMNAPRVYTCSPSWTPLSPPSPYHPSGSSQCTSPEHPVSCMEPGLAIHFLYDIIHVSMLRLDLYLFWFTNAFNRHFSIFV